MALASKQLSRTCHKFVLFFPVIETLFTKNVTIKRQQHCDGGLFPEFPRRSAESLSDTAAF